MRKTRNLFLICGSRSRVSLVLDELTFKGLVTVPIGTEVRTAFLRGMFAKNKSVACYAGEYTDVFSEGAKDIKEKAIVIYVSAQEPYDALNIISLPSKEPIAKQFERIALAHDCNIGDHRSNISNGANDGPTIADCAYCKYLEGNSGDNDRMIYMSKSFFVLATVGQFVTGYLLIIPKRHIMSNAELTSDELEEFKDVLDDVEYLLKLTYGHRKILVWENGSGTAGTSKAKDSVVHSHVHVVASELTAEEVESESGLEFTNIELEDLYKYAASSYLLMRTEKNHSVWKICPSDDVFIPRQWIRNEVAEKMGITDESWNWRKYPFRENMRLTVEQIRASVIENWDRLPNRIKKCTRCLIKEA